MTPLSPAPLPRDHLVERLHADLVGPRAPDEVLVSRPSDVWLTGVLWPRNTALAPEEDERLAIGAGGEGGEDAEDQATPVAASTRRPSTAGLSFALRATGGEALAVDVEVRFGLYEPEQDEAGKTVWRRREVVKTIESVSLASGAREIPLGEAAVAAVHLHVRATAFSDGQLATVTLVNACSSSERGREALERLTLFQVAVEIRPCSGSDLIARPARRAAVDNDDRSGALLYRHAREYAAGHTCSAEWEFEPAARVALVRTTWLPQAVTPAVSGDGHSVFSALRRDEDDPLSAGWLARSTPEGACAGLIRLCDAYGAWIGLQQAETDRLEPEYVATARRHLDDARRALARMRAGVARLQSDDQIWTAFRLANLVMDAQRRWGGEGPLQWRPFQLGFLLLTLESAVDGDHPDRGVMDLLWFPTGGGKTEAYLGLIALVAFHRRLSRDAPDQGAGVAVIMRYTLRLLTTQQFERAAAMIAACEAVRRGRLAAQPHGDLGASPFSIGLWVGGDATPNRRTEAYDSQRDPGLPSPRQLTSCPCCRKPLEYRQPGRSDPVTVWCVTDACTLAGAPLPVWTVDEDVYQERPTLLIGTVDKFAQIVRKKETAELFGVGRPAQPQLVLQDELHLIAGPLGTLAGLYETALDLILSAGGTRPKIIGSTATIRRASEQVEALFDRATSQFPPPGLDAADSGFAVVDPLGPGRLYVGVTSAGRSAKFALQGVSASLLQSAAAGLSAAERDPYWTLVAYFNSLRELGGALVLTQDDVRDTIDQLARARNETPRSPGSVEELTSRRTQAEIREMLDRLKVTADRPDALDVVLATNMLSVGVDIPRLGLMLVNGQPKTMAEYIQATSRVGRGRVAGLVVPVLNGSKPRDRSHYETFRTWHATLYREVEATSVTPFASRARDRALHAVLVAVVRHLSPGMLDSPALSEGAIAHARDLIDRIVERAERIDALEVDVRAELEERLARWVRRAPQEYWRRPAVSLMQPAEAAAAKRAAGRSIGQAWPTPNTMRGVEPSTPFRLIEHLRT